MANRNQIERFLAKYGTTPLDTPLRKKWLMYLAKQNQSELFKHFYKDIGNASLNCKYAEMLLQKDPSSTQAFDLFLK